MARGRRVRRVIRRIDSWSVLKVSVLFYLALMLVVLLAGIILWLAGETIGAVGSIEEFMQGIGFDDFRFVGVQLLRGFVASGLVIVVLGTGLTVLMAVVYNLIADVVGGIQLTVLEEESPASAVPVEATMPDTDTSATSTNGVRRAEPAGRQAS